MIVKIRNFIRWIVIIVRHFIYRTLFKMDINKSARLSFGAKLDKTYPIGLHMLQVVLLFLHMILHGIFIAIPI